MPYLMIEGSFTGYKWITEAVNLSFTDRTLAHKVKYRKDS